MLNFDLIAAPRYAAARQQLPDPPAESALLVLYDEGYDFLAKVLTAAGYRDLPDGVHLVVWSAAEEGLDLLALARELNAHRLLLFGQDPARLGLHLQLANFFPVTVAGRRLMLCPSLPQIAAAKAAGDNGPAAALWRGLQNGFLADGPPP